MNANEAQVHLAFQAALARAASRLGLPPDRLITVVMEELGNETGGESKEPSVARTTRGVVITNVAYDLICNECMYSWCSPAPKGNCPRCHSADTRRISDEPRLMDYRKV